MIQRVWRGSQDRIIYKRRVQLRLRYSSSSSAFNKNSKKSFFHKIIKTSAKRLKVWASSSPYNYFHRYQIILGILQACKDKPELAYNHFQQAIDSAKLNEYLLEEALANELWALVLERKQQSKYANVHLLEAHYIYSIWGSKPKVTLLEETNPYIEQVEQLRKTGLEDITWDYINDLTDRKEHQEFLHKCKATLLD
jgi:hypothetical protein